MKRLLLILLFAAAVFAVDKSAFDLQSPTNSLGKTAGILPHSEELEICLTEGGYFTIGTVQGDGDTPFDDHCNITYGHPFALTSYPSVSIDGDSRKLEGWLPPRLAPTWGDNSLSLQATHNGVEMTFTIAVNGAAVDLTLDIHNTDDQPHDIGMGLVFDPALGQWGDGCVTMGGEQMLQAQTLRGTSIVNEFSITERSEAPTGMGVNVNLQNSQPDELQLANWDDLEGFRTGSASEMLFDLCLQFAWDETTVAAGERRSVNIRVSLTEPQWGHIFTRWDAPRAFSIENGQLFPNQLKTMLRAMNPGSNSQTNVQYHIQAPEIISAPASLPAITAEGQGSAYSSFDLSAVPRYEDLIVPLTIACKQGNETVEQFTRYLFVPAEPLSDTGLIVNVDSLSVSGFPTVELFFNVENQETGFPLTALQPYHIFLYENEERIRDFTLEKFTGGSSGGQADVCFVLDCSGSMGDEINAVRDNLAEFAQTLRDNGYDFKIAALTFSTTVDDVWDFTDDIGLMEERLAGVQLWGGTEDSPSALMRATELSWRPTSVKNIIWITDEPYPEHNYTQETVVNEMLSSGIRVHGVGTTDLQTDWFDPIVLPTGGKFYDINGNFRDIMLDVTNVEAINKYVLSYSSSATQDAIQDWTIEVHHAGFGGSAIIPMPETTAATALSCYPNPFNPVVHIQTPAVSGQAELEIYNILGQRVRGFTLQPNTAQTVIWDATDAAGAAVSSGFYLVRMTTQLSDGTRQNHVSKILYMK